MLKGMFRFVLITALSMLVAPQLSRLLDRLADKAPQGSLLEDSLLEFSDRYSTSLLRSLGEALGDLVLPSR
jgi:hypothetical protein